MRWVKTRSVLSWLVYCKHLRACSTVIHGVLLWPVHTLLLLSHSHPTHPTPTPSFAVAALPSEVERNTHSTPPDPRRRFAPSGLRNAMQPPRVVTGHQTHLTYTLPNPLQYAGLTVVLSHSGENHHRARKPSLVSPTKTPQHHPKKKHASHQPRSSQTPLV